eukprot:363761-Chlamydomonas_euryale.AAC.24
MTGTSVSSSITAQPENTPSWSRPPGVGTSAGGRLFQCTMSSDTAWPHMRPKSHTAEAGRY